MQWLLYILILPCVIAGLAMYRGAERKRCRTFDARSPLDWDGWLREHTDGDSTAINEVCPKVVESIGSAIGIVPEKIYPDDRFGVELALRRKYLLDDTCDAIEAELSERFGRKLILPPHCHTVEQLIFAISEAADPRPHV